MGKRRERRPVMWPQASAEVRSQHRQGVRARILAAAAELFLHEGYAGFSMRKLAAAVEYSPGILYFYFRDKDDLLFGLVDEGFAAFGKRLETAYGATTDARRRLVVIARAYVEFGLENRELYQLMFAQRPDYLSRTNTDQPDKLMTFEIFGLAVEYAVQQGVLFSDSIAGTSDALWATVHGVVMLALHLPDFDAARIETMMEQSLRLIVGDLHQR